MKLTPSDWRQREALLAERRKATAPKPEKPRTMAEIAEKYGIAFSTLKARRAREPDTPLEELARRPLENQAERARVARAAKEKKTKSRQPGRPFIYGWKATREEP